MPFLRYHATVERRIRELGIGFTFLQPNLYFKGLLAFQPVKPPPQTAGRPIPVSRYLDCEPALNERLIDPHERESSPVRWDHLNCGERSPASLNLRLNRTLNGFCLNNEGCKHVCDFIAGLTVSDIDRTTEIIIRSGQAKEDT